MNELKTSECGCEANEAVIREARERVIASLREAILASADVLKLENHRAECNPGSVHGLMRGAHTDPEVLRRFLKCPVYTWVTRDYAAGTADYHLLCKMADLLHELAPRVFRRPDDPPPELMP